MQPAAPLLCPACGTPISAFGGRCPSCGAELPRETQPRPARARARARRRAPERPARWRGALIGLGAAIAIAAAAGGYWHLRRTSQALELASNETADAPRTTPAAPVAIDPLDLGNALVVARRRAQSWHADAQLVSISVSAVDKGKVEDGTIELEFGKSKTSKLGPRSPLTGERLVVTISGSEPTSIERRGPAAESIGDPNCPLQQAWRKMVASGIPSNATVSMRYELSKRHDRAVWNATVIEQQGLSRVLDGNNCAILSR